MRDAGFPWAWMLGGVAAVLGVTAIGIVLRRRRPVDGFEQEVRRLLDERERDLVA
jgi:hypothetical protein